MFRPGMLPPGALCRGPGPPGCTPSLSSSSGCPSSGSLSWLCCSKRSSYSINNWHMMSLTILNVNANTNPRLCGFTLLRREKAAWFPTEELRDDNNVQPHKVIVSLYLLELQKKVREEFTILERAFSCLKAPTY